MKRFLTAGLTTAVLVAFPSPADASFLSPELEDKLATFLALFVLFVVAPAVLLSVRRPPAVAPEPAA